MALQYYGQYIAYDTEVEVLAANGKFGDVAVALDTKMRYMCTSTNTWFPTDATRIIRGTASVNLMTSSANTKILALPTTTFRFVVLGVHAEVTTLTGTIVTQPTVSIGATGTTYADIAPAQALSGSLLSLGLTSTNALTIASARAPLPGSTDVYVRLGTLGAAIGPSVYTATFDLFGYFKV